jgi:hypothetical protein
LPPERPMAQECDQCDVWHLEPVIEPSNTRPLWHGSPRLPPPTVMPGIAIRSG